MKIHPLESEVMYTLDIITLKEYIIITDKDWASRVCGYEQDGPRGSWRCPGQIQKPLQCVSLVWLAQCSC